MPESLAKLGSRKLCFLLFEVQRCVFVHASGTCVCRLVPAGLVLLVCTKPPRAGLDTKTEQSWLLFVVPFFLASGSLVGTAKRLE